MQTRAYAVTIRSPSAGIRKISRQCRLPLLRSLHFAHVVGVPDSRQIKMSGQLLTSKLDESVQPFYLPANSNIFFVT